MNWCSWLPVYILVPACFVLSVPVGSLQDMTGKSGRCRSYVSCWRGKSIDAKHSLRQRLTGANASGPYSLWLAC